MSKPKIENNLNIIKNIFEILTFEEINKENIVSFFQTSIFYKKINFQRE